MVYTPSQQLQSFTNCVHFEWLRKVDRARRVRVLKQGEEISVFESSIVNNHEQPKPRIHPVTGACGSDQPAECIEIHQFIFTVVNANVDQTNPSECIQKHQFIFTVVNANVDQTNPSECIQKHQFIFTVVNANVDQTSQQNALRYTSLSLQ